MRKSSGVPCKPHARDSYLPLFRVRRHGEGPCGDPRDVGVYPCGGGDDPSYPSLFCGHLFPSLLALGILVPLPSGKFLKNAILQNRCVQNALLHASTGVISLRYFLIETLIETRVKCKFCLIK